MGPRVGLDSSVRPRQALEAGNPQFTEALGDRDPWPPVLEAGPALEGHLATWAQHIFDQ